MNTTRRSSHPIRRGLLALGAGAVLLASPSVGSAQAATGSGVAGAAGPTSTVAAPGPTEEQSAVYVPTFWLVYAWCTAHRRDLMLPGQAGIEHCVQNGF